MLTVLVAHSCLILPNWNGQYLDWGDIFQNQIYNPTLVWKCPENFVISSLLFKHMSNWNILNKAWTLLLSFCCSLLSSFQLRPVKFWLIGLPTVWPSKFLSWCVWDQPRKWFYCLGDLRQRCAWPNSNYPWFPLITLILSGEGLKFFLFFQSGDETHRCVCFF